MSNQPRKPAGAGLFGWLGRQVGYVKKAVKAPVKPKAEQTIVYRDDKVEEATHPTQPGVKLRRTVIDEVIVDPDKRVE